MIIINEEITEGIQDLIDLLISKGYELNNGETALYWHIKHTIESHIKDPLPTKGLY